MTDADTEPDAIDAVIEDAIRDLDSGRNASFDRSCPVCDEPFQTIIRPGCDIMSPDEGEWCFTGGQFFVHETLKYRND
jgi:hypothetical protein